MTQIVDKKEMELRRLGARPGDLPRDAWGLLIILEDMSHRIPGKEGVSIPKDVDRIGQALRRIEYSDAQFEKSSNDQPPPRDSQMGRLSRAIGRLHSQRPGVIDVLDDWLHRPEVIHRFRALRSAHKFWTDACARLKDGVATRKALFGTEQGRRPYRLHFSAVDHAALLAVYLVRLKGEKRPRATTRALNFISTSELINKDRPPNPDMVRRAYERELSHFGLGDEGMLQCQAQHIAAHHNLDLHRL